MPRERKMEVSASVIVHATEDPRIITGAASQMLGIQEDTFTGTNTTGHFGNPISVYDANITGADAALSVRRFVGMLSGKDVDALAVQIQERTVDSRLHLRIDKQVLIRNGRPEIIGLHRSEGREGEWKENGGSKDAIKIKIHTPIYSKKDAVPTFAEILRGSA
ncbi:MAG: exosome protein [Nitrosopumilaceae archaeon]|nr:exosome protein [Nitrosopumilaceae archaeon]